MAQKLKVVDLPEGAGPVEMLFNGKDLTGWDLWLGYEDPGMTYRRKAEVEPVGTRPPPEGSIGVVIEDGEPAIFVGGKLNGSLMSRGDYGNYHAHLEFKFSPETMTTPRSRPNSGLLFHSYGAPGSAFGTWANSIEFQMQHGSNGMAIPVGLEANGHVRVGADRIKHRFMPDGVQRELRGWPQTEPNSDAERPVGEWNTFDLYTVGDHAVYVVNDIPVMEISDLVAIGADGKKVPLTHGRLQLELEGSKTFFRRIRIEPIKTLPRIVPQ